MIESTLQILTGKRNSIILDSKAHHNIAKWICWKDSKVKKTYAQMKVSPTYTATINKRKNVKRRRLYESSFDRKVSNFKLLVTNELFFICVICSSCLYRASVICFNTDKYRVDENIIIIFVRPVIKHCERIMFHVRLLQID